MYLTRRVFSYTLSHYVLFGKASASNFWCPSSQLTKLMYARFWHLKAKKLSFCLLSPENLANTIYLKLWIVIIKEMYLFCN